VEGCLDLREYSVRLRWNRIFLLLLIIIIKCLFWVLGLPMTLAPITCHYFSLKKKTRSTSDLLVSSTRRPPPASLDQHCRHLWPVHQTCERTNQDMALSIVMRCYSTVSIGGEKYAFSHDIHVRLLHATHKAHPSCTLKSGYGVS
jgi:hypothetical protein